MRPSRLVLVVSLGVLLIAVLVLGQTGNQVLDSLWGKDITVGELIGATDPGELAGMSEKMRNTHVTWVQGTHYTTTSYYVGAAVPTEP